MQPNRKPLNIWLCIATLVVFNWSLPFLNTLSPNLVSICGCIHGFDNCRIQRDIKKKITDNEVMEEERTINNRKKYNQILLFWSIIIVMTVLAIMLLLGINYVSIENIILAFCIILLGCFTFNSYLSKKIGAQLCFIQ